MTYTDILAVEGVVAAVIAAGFVITAVGRRLLTVRKHRREEAAVTYQRALDRRDFGYGTRYPQPVTPVAYAWLDIPLPEARKLALIAAGIAPDAALDPATVALDDDALNVLATLHPAKVREPAHWDAW